MDLLIVSGMSGAGKTLALQTLEDMGYYCMDNLPPQLLLYLLNTELGSGFTREKMAVTVDIRSDSLLHDIEQLKKGLSENGIMTRILFLDAADELLHRRYKETRRLHPLIRRGEAMDLAEALEQERERLAELRSQSDIVLDTSHFQAAELRQKLVKLFADAHYTGMSIEFVAFGFKYGILADADLVFDVRCLPNPYYEASLRTLTGNDAAVRDYVLSSEEARTMYDKIRDYLEYSIPLYKREGKTRLVVGFGCTGGQHRSLAFAGMLKEYFEKNYSGVSLSCRDAAENRYEIIGRMGDNAIEQH